MSTSVRIAGIGTLVLALLGLTHTAEGAVIGKIFWSEAVSGQIARADLDGTNIEILAEGLTAPYGVALAVAGNALYWSEQTLPRVIRRSNLDGSQVETIVTLTGAARVPDIEIDQVHGKMYWVEHNTRRAGRANLDGTDVEMLVSTDDAPCGIAVDPFAGYIYWSESASIHRARLDGTNNVALVTGLDYPRGIDLDLAGGHLYWANGSGSGRDGTLQRANLDGTGVEYLFSDGLAPMGVALDLVAGKVYWTDFTAAKIQRANLDGTMVEDVIFTGLAGPDSIALIPLPEPSCVSILIFGLMLLTIRRR